MDDFVNFENGFYDDDGKKISDFAIPLPSLCVICKVHQSNAGIDTLLCKMNRFDQKDDLDNFECGAFENIKY